MPNRRMLECQVTVLNHLWPCAMFVYFKHIIMVCVIVMSAYRHKLSMLAARVLLYGCHGCAMCRNEVPNFFNSTKFFSCLDLKESQELFETTQMVIPCSLQLLEMTATVDAGCVHEPG